MNIKIDRSGKNIIRLCFVSWDEAIYYNKSSPIFEHCIIPEKKNESDFSATVQKDKVNWENEIAKYHVYTQQKIEYKNNFIYLSASNCNRVGVPIRATILYASNQFDIPKSEMERTIESAYQDYQKEANSKRIKMVKKIEKVVRKETNSIKEHLIQSPVFSDKIFDQLSSILKKGCQLFKDKRERDVFLTGALAVLSSCMPNVKGTYDKAIQYLNLFAFIIAPAASGKGAMSSVFRLEHHKFLFLFTIKNAFHYFKILK